MKKNNFSRCVFAFSLTFLTLSQTFKPVQVSAKSAVIDLDTTQRIFEAYNQAALDSVVDAVRINSLGMQLLYAYLRMNAGNFSYDIGNACSVSGYYYYVTQKDNQFEYTKGVCSSFAANYTTPSRTPISSGTVSLCNSSNGTLATNYYLENQIRTNTSITYDSSIDSFSYVGIILTNNGAMADYLTSGSDYFSIYSGGGNNNRHEYSCNYRPTGSTTFPNELPHWFLSNRRVPPSNPIASPAYHLGFPHSPEKMPPAVLSTPSDWDNYAVNTLIPYIKEIDPDAPDFLTVPQFDGFDYPPDFPLVMFPDVSMPTESVPAGALNGLSFWFSNFTSLIEKLNVQWIIVALFVLGLLFHILYRF